MPVSTKRSSIDRARRGRRPDARTWALGGAIATGADVASLSRHCRRNLRYTAVAAKRLRHHPFSGLDDLGLDRLQGGSARTPPAQISTSTPLSVAGVPAAHAAKTSRTHRRQWRGVHSARSDAIGADAWVCVWT